MLRCLEVAVGSSDRRRSGHLRPLWSLLVGINGGISGLRVAALPIELPVTTMLMLRAIADTARHQGEDLSRLEARLACVEVFALGARGSGKRMDMGYFASRALLGKLPAKRRSILPNAASRAPRRRPSTACGRDRVAVRGGRLRAVRASAVPVLGAVGGATVNFVFMNHFQRVAHGHFTIRRLERMYGPADGPPPVRDSGSAIRGCRNMTLWPRGVSAVSTNG